MNTKPTQLEPAIRLGIGTYEFKNGTKISVVHDLNEADFGGLLERWLRKTKRFTAMSLVESIKKRRPYCICVTKEQYDEVTAGKGAGATREEWEAENPLLANKPQPYESTDERDRHFQSVAAETAQRYGIPVEVAKIRLKALSKSGILDGSGPDDKTVQERIDNFLSTPQP